jgi:pimeloyl-ACP methyl ester carboxylesterase
MAILDRDGVTIHYEAMGRPTERPPLLLSHGYGASAAMWKPNLDALARDRQVITWDMRGHGHSASPTDPARYSIEATVDDMSAVLDACGAQRAVLGGMSLGGYLSLTFHLAHRARVAALLLVDTGPGFRDDGARARWNRLAESIAAGYEREGLAAIPDSPEVGPGPHNVAGLVLAARGILTQHDSRVLDALPTISVPTLVVVGADDQPFLAPADYMATKIPGASKVVLADAGHAANMDQAAAFNRHARAFLDRHA